MSPGCHVVECQLVRSYSAVCCPLGHRPSLEPTRTWRRTLVSRDDGTQPPTHPANQHTRRTRGRSSRCPRCAKPAARSPSRTRRISAARRSHAKLPNQMVPRATQLVFRERCKAVQPGCGVAIAPRSPSQKHGGLRSSSDAVRSARRTLSTLATGVSSLLVSLSPCLLLLAPLSSIGICASLFCSRLVPFVLSAPRCRPVGIPLGC